MAGGDRTGPNGMGPLTGRGAGYCAGNQVPGYMQSAPGRGFGSGFGRGFGFGRGRGWRNWFQAAGVPGWLQAPAAGYQPPELPPDTEKQMLSSQVDTLQKQLEAVNKRLAELEEK